MQVTTNPDDMMWADDIRRWQRVPVVIINGDDDDDDKPQWRRRRTTMITTTSYSPQRTMIIFTDDEISPRTTKVKLCTRYIYLHERLQTSATRE